MGFAPQIHVGVRIGIEGVRGIERFDTPGLFFGPQHHIRT